MAKFNHYRIIKFVEIWYRVEKYQSTKPQLILTYLLRNIIVKFFVVNT